MPAATPPAREKFIALLRASVRDGTLVKLTLGKHRGADATLHNLFVRPVTLKAGPHLSLLWRHATRDITKNHPPAEALALIEPLIGGDFLDAHLFTPAQNAQLETRGDGTARLSVKTAATAPVPAPETHDREKSHLISGDAPWLRALGVTNARGLPREGMAHKFRQIQKFTELLASLLAEAGLTSDSQLSGGSHLSALDSRLLHITDMGCGKGYLTFALAAHLGPRAEVTGIEFRPELVQFCNELARHPAHPLPHLRFVAGDIASTTLDRLD
ncbi:MAG TPA: methyltransferase, partial [Rariglobus sp.]